MALGQSHMRKEAPHSWRSSRDSGARPLPKRGIRQGSSLGELEKLEWELTSLGDVAQQQGGGSLGHRTPKGSSSLGSNFIASGLVIYG